MELKRVENEKEWQEFVVEFGPRSGGFLHSNEWVDYQKIEESTVKKLAWYENESIIGVAVLVKKSLPFGFVYAYCPRGPIFRAKDFEAKRVVELGDWAKQNWRSMFLRFEPTVENAEAVSGKGLKSVTSVQPAHTLVLDLSLGIEKLMSMMHQKTRYNIRLATKKGVTVRELDRNEFDLVWDLFRITSDRDEFRLHDKAHYEALLDNVKSEAKARMVGAFFEDKLIAANIQIDFAGTRTYLHGASSNLHRNVMAPYAIHDFEIKDAIVKGLRWYDFWGISDTNPDWRGITRFKRGFGGEELKYPGTFDLVLDNTKYLLYSTARKVIYRRG